MKFTEKDFKQPNPFDSLTFLLVCFILCSIVFFYFLNSDRAANFRKGWQAGYDAAIVQWETGEDVCENGINPFDSPFKQKYWE